jgi:parallel beta-helix repeat protein
VKIVFNSLVIIFVAIRVAASNYYLSAKGNDLQNGASALTPWRTLKRLSEAMQLLHPGDSILFERGSVFAGELKISASGNQGKEIYVGAYGSGAKPVISGAKEIKGWTLFRGNIWVADCTDCIAEPENLFLDDRYQPLGRYPNSGYMTLSCNSKCKTTLSDNHLEFADGYWDGSEVVVKSSRWTLDNLPVSNYFNKTFYFSVDASYPLQGGFGYFVQKHLATLDIPGEWFFDRDSKKTFFYCSEGDKPGNHTIEVSITDVGLEIVNVNFVTIENIIFKYQRMSGVQVRFSNNISLRNCVIEHSGNNGIELTSCQNPRIENCRIENSNNNGVEWKDNSNGSFLRNLVRRTGLHPGRGESGNGTYIGLSVTANDHALGKNTFQYNTVDSTGYIGIDFRTGSTSVKNNMVSNFCMVKDDGAGIYTWGNAYSDNLIDGNIVLHGTGCGAGTNDQDQVWVHGIYIDDRSSDINVSNNTIAYCGTNGIFIHNAKRITIQGNILFANGSHLANKENSQLLIKLDDLVPDGDKYLDLHVTENRLVALQENNHCIYLRDEKTGGVSSFGLFDGNRYSAIRENQVVAEFNSHQDGCSAIEEFKLSDWQQCTENDKSSSFNILNGAPNESYGPNLIKNSRMTNGAEGWIAWPSQVSIVQDKGRGVDGPSLRVQFPSGRFEGLLYHAGISLSSNKMYRLSFTAMSTAKSKIEFAPLMASSPWAALGDYTCFSIDTVFKSFSYFFKPARSSKDARVNFKSNATFWIDNVTLFEVVKTGTQEPVQLLYNANEKPNAFSPPGKFNDIDGNQLSVPLTLQGYGSILLLKHK